MGRIQSARATSSNMALTLLMPIQFFDFPMVTREDDREYDDGEQRLQTLAILQGHIVFIVWVERNTGAHIISIRKAERHEQKIYLEATGQ